ncbi:MAG: hypothetical protein H0T89_11545 [Deltaproteobacteria bacterium]|nr:hypothetical protein [Deltaproteobacteria bacterium]
MTGTICIYCKAELTPSTRWAHVWPASMGGRLKSRKVCCDKCNNATGPVEDQLRESLGHTFASVGATNDERDPFEVAIDFEGHEFVLSNGNALLEVSGRRFDREAKQIIVPLPAGFENQVEVLAKALHSAGKGPEAASTLGLTPGDPEPVLPIGATRHDHDLKVGGSIEHKRVFAKLALELLAHRRHDLATRGELSEARRFARHGTGTVQSKPDTRSEGSGLLSGLTLPEVYNAIEVWSSGRSVFFRVVFLGPLVFTGTLTTEWAGDPFRAAYAFDARNPARAIANHFEDRDGPNLAIWFVGMVEETVETAVAALEAISLRLAQAAPRVERETPPDLEQLRVAVAARLAEMQTKRK